MYAAAVFDLDGTILDTLDDLQLCLNHTLDAHGFAPYTRAEVRAMVGNGLRRLMLDACPDGTPQEEVDSVFEDFCAYYAEHCNDHTGPYPGIVAMVERLREAGVRCAVVSNKGDFAVRELMDLHFPAVFDFVLGQRDDIPRKPAPDMVYAAMAALEADQTNSVYVGDSEVDVVTAANSGIPCLSVTWGFRDPEWLAAHGARCQVDSVEALGQAILA
ncbi:HAD-IA family hydrolase [Atopobiaceae bacterium 24-176]